MSAVLLVLVLLAALASLWSAVVATRAAWHVQRATAALERLAGNVKTASRTGSPPR